MNTENFTTQKAWELMEEKGFSLGEKSNIRKVFQNEYKNEHPFIENKFNNSWNKMTYFSKHKQISSNVFLSEKEVIIANAIFENVKDNFNADEFRNHLKYIFRILGIKSEWA